MIWMKISAVLHSRYVLEVTDKSGNMRVLYHTFGCKANQYDTELMRQELEALGALTVDSDSPSDVCVVNTCTVTNAADADARRGAAIGRCGARLHHHDRRLRYRRLYPL